MSTETLSATSTLADGAAALRAALREGPSEDLLQLTSELGQVRSLLSDAIANLQKSFYELDAQVQAQRDQLTTLISAMDGSGGSKRNTPENLRAFVDEITALFRFFADLLTQVAGQNTDGAERVETMALELTATFKLLGQFENVEMQTKLLALNAMIEASRVGESGKAFGVVAQEVKNLSAFSRQLNEDISSQLLRTKSAMSEIRQMLVETRDKGYTARTRIDALLEKLNVFDGTISIGLVQIGLISLEVSGNVATAIRALQFEDLVGQLLDCVQKRLQRLSGVVTALGSLGESEPASTESFVTELAQRALEIRATYANTVVSPVKQGNVTEGSIELF